MTDKDRNSAVASTAQAGEILFLVPKYKKIERRKTKGRHGSRERRGRMKRGK